MCFSILLLPLSLFGAHNLFYCVLFSLRCSRKMKFSSTTTSFCLLQVSLTSSA